MTSLKLLILSVSLITLIGCSLEDIFGEKKSDPPTISGTLIYEEVNQRKTNTPITVIPTGTLVSNTAQTVKYTINPALPTGASIDEITGEIDLPAAVVNQPRTEEYTITATGIGSYTGTINATFRLHLALSAIGGTLAYTDTAVDFGTAGTINPSWTGVATGQNTSLTYSIADAPAGITINATSGVISIAATAPVQIQQTYTVTVVGKNTFAGRITVNVKIAIIVAEIPIVIAYNGTESADVGGAVLGPFIKEPTTGTGAFSDSEVLNVTGLTAGATYTYILGTSASSTGTKIADGTGKITIQRSDIEGTNAVFGVNMTLTGGGIKATNQNIATYTGDIYTWKDLQAMRRNLAGAYILKADITFPSNGNDELPATGFEPIGYAGTTTTNGTYFTGSLDGNNKKIVNFFISTTTVKTGVGLFGAIKPANATTVSVKNLVLENPSVTGPSLVGGVAGILYQGVMEGVQVTASSSAGTDVKIKATSAITTANEASSIGAHGGWTTSGSTIVGGIVGAGGVSSTGGNNIVATLKKVANVGVPIEGYKNRVGGLAGLVVSGKVVGYSTATIKLTGTDHTSYIGGLVGLIRYNGQVIGYATGNIERTVANAGRNNSETGGLVGNINTLSGKQIKVIGYYTGEIKGATNFQVVGGLVGGISNGGTTDVVTIRGYFTGSINGTSFRGGGLVGHDAYSTANLVRIQGYNRGSITITGTNPTSIKISTILGESNRGTNNAAVGFYSTKAGEGQILYLANPLTGTTTPAFAAVIGWSSTNAYAGSAVSAPTGAASPGSFAGLAFGNAEGQWLYTASKWPAINLGTDMPSGHTGTSSQTTIIDP